MKDNKDDLTQEEQRILSDYESGQLQSVDNLEERKDELQSAVRNTLNKTRNINIRVTEKDLLRLKAKAIEEGIPYQTLVSSILHKSASSYPPEISVGYYKIRFNPPVDQTATTKEYSVE